MKAPKPPPFHILCFTGVNSAPGVTRHHLVAVPPPDFYMSPEVCLLRAPISLPLSLRLWMWNLTYLVKPGSIAVTRRDFIRSHSNVEWPNWEETLSVTPVTSVPLKWGNETLLLLPCHQAQDLRMPSCFSERFWMDDVQALPYIEWDSRSYFARLNAIGKFHWRDSIRLR